MPHTERRRHCFLDYVDGLPTGGFRLARDGRPYSLHSRCRRVSSLEHAVAEDDSTKRDGCTWLVDLSNHNIRLHCGRAGRRAVLPTTRRKGAHPRRCKAALKCWYGESWVRLLKGDASLAEAQRPKRSMKHKRLCLLNYLGWEEIRLVLSEVMDGRRSSFGLERQQET